MTHKRSFTRDPASVGAARRFALETLSGIIPSDAIEAIQLMVSELATNCIRHTNTAFDITIARIRGEIRIEVTDRAGGTPTMRSPAPFEPTGRGLQIVDMLSKDWGVEQRTQSGKTVWFTLATSAQAVA
jgi:anti-sigma regulatory factor (Ser/Thr protein kinase)